MKNRLIILVILVVLVGFGGYWYVNYITKVEKITCEDQFGTCEIDFESHMLGRPVKTVRDELNQILDENPSIKEYSIRFVFPRSFKINVITSVPKYALNNPDFIGYVLINEEGYVTKIVENTQLPAVKTSFELPNVGEKVDEKSLFALKLNYRLNQLDKFPSADLIDDRLIVKDDSGVQIIFPTSGDQDVLLGSIVLIRSRLKEAAEEIKIENISEIDLRFEKPVLR